MIASGTLRGVGVRFLHTCAAVRTVFMQCCACIVCVNILPPPNKLLNSQHTDIRPNQNAITRARRATTKTITYAKLAKCFSRVICASECAAWIGETAGSDGAPRAIRSSVNGIDVPAPQSEFEPETVAGADSIVISAGVRASGSSRKMKQHSKAPPSHN